MKRLSVLELLAVVLCLVLMIGCGGGGDNPSPPPSTTSTAVIGASGGSVTSADGKTAVQIPAGALPADTAIVMTVVVDANLGQVGPLYQVTAQGVDELVFSTPVTVTLKYDPGLLSPGAIESESKLALAGPLASWEILWDSVVDTINHTVTATTPHFSDIGMLQTFPDNSIVPKLGFPLPYPLNPYNATIESVFDHSMTKVYRPNGVVVAYSGDEAKASSSKIINVNSYTGGDPLGYSYPYVNSPYVNSQGNTIPNYDSRNPNDPNGPPVLAYDGHPGYDYAVPLGTPVYAVTAGKVTVYRESECWNADNTAKDILVHKPAEQCAGIIYIVDDENDTYSTWYVHLYQKSVKTGDTVKRGQQIGLSGKTAATADHLHFEVRINLHTPVDPYAWDGTSGTDPYQKVIGADSVNLWDMRMSLDISGSWNGTYTYTLSTGASATYEILLRLTQSGTNVSGIWTTKSGVSGTVTGTVSGNNINLRFTQTSPCAGAFNITGTAAGDTMTTTSGNGSDCSNTYTNIKGSVFRNSIS